MPVYDYYLHIQTLQPLCKVIDLPFLSTKNPISPPTIYSPTSHTPINPRRIPKLPLPRLEHLLRSAVVTPLPIRQLDIKLRDRPSRHIEPRPVILILSLQRPVTIPRWIPIDIPRAENAAV